MRNDHVTLRSTAVFDLLAPRTPAVPVKVELREILSQAEAICQAAGTTLKNAVRIQQFHANLADLPATLEVWSEATAGMPLPMSPIEVPWLPVPHARLQVDLWVYIPE